MTCARSRATSAASRAPRALAKALRLPHTRSRWERQFLRWITNLEGIPAPLLNDKVGPLTVDCHWPDHNLVIELDTDQTHGTAWKKRDDTERDDWLEDRRRKEVWRVERDTWDPNALAAQLHERLVSRP